MCIDLHLVRDWMSPAAELCYPPSVSPFVCNQRTEEMFAVRSACLAHNGEFKSKELQNSVNQEAIVGL